jgi:3-hydroxybutyryl-CoA dehydratase
MIGDTVTAQVCIEEIDTRRRRVKLKTECLVNGKVVTTGSAVMMVDNKPS